MLVNARLSYILVNGLHFRSGRLVIFTVNPLASLHFQTDSELHLATETEQDRTRLLIFQYKQRRFRTNLRYVHLTRAWCEDHLRFRTEIRRMRGKWLPVHRGNVLDQVPRSCYLLKKQKFKNQDCKVKYLKVQLLLD